MNEPVRLSDITRCFYGVIPGAIATVDRNGVPNITYVSQVHYLDDGHVALSRQFFNKTSRNLDETRIACVELYDPVTFEAYRLKLRFLRTEVGGELFEKMATRIDAIASHTGMKGVFRLIGCDVFEVIAAVRVAGFLQEAGEEVSERRDLSGARGELRGLQVVSDRIVRAGDLDALFEGVLDSLEEAFGFGHTMLLIREGEELVTVASRGYGEAGIGATVRLGEGLIGTAAERRQASRVTGVEEGLRYGRAARRSLESAGLTAGLEIPLPGLSGVQASLVIPLWVEDELIGALSAESRDPMAFDDWHEAYLELIGNQVALGIARMIEVDAGESEPVESVSSPALTPPADPGRRRFSYYRKDECLFLDDDYLIRNVPAKIMWKLLQEWKGSGRVDFTNRELRLDDSLGLPELRDNLESRLILLRKRLDQKCSDVKIVPTGRGRFSLVVPPNIELQER